MSQVIVITGMGRSGTSLVSSLLQSAGVHIGDQLLPPYPDNPRGYFEDVEFYEFHERLLHDRNQTYLYIDTDFVVEPTAAELERAQQLITARTQRPIWGWKDPRTALFLDFWYQLLPHARFLFVYRHPVEVLLSLLRRGEFDNHPYLAAGLRAWQIFNANIEAFCERHPDQCLLAHIGGVASKVEQFADLLRRKLQMNVQLNSAAFDQIYHANELQKMSLPRDAEDVLAKICPGVLELYSRLNARADLPPASSLSDAASPPSLSTLARFTAGLPEPIAVPVVHTVLQLLVALLAPGPTETALSRFHQNVRGAQRTVEHLWLQVQRLERTNTEQNEILTALRDQLDAQHAKFAAQETQQAAQQTELEAQRIQLETQRAELQLVYEKRTWRLMQSYSRIKERWHKKAG